MAKIFKPRRGKKSTMAGSKKATVLSAGEMFIEVPDTGAGTGHSKMKIGDGSTQYSSLPYAMGDTENDKIAFSNDTSGNITTALNKVTSGAALKTMIAALKQAVSLANTSITQLNDELEIGLSQIIITGIPERIGETVFKPETTTSVNHTFTAPDYYFSQPFSLHLIQSDWAGIFIQQYDISEENICTITFYNSTTSQRTLNPLVQALFQKNLYWAIRNM